MHELATEIISKNVERIIEDYDYENQKKANLHGCICYEQDVKCHNIENLNCFFCYCPNYDRTVKEGGCKIDSPDGKYTETAKDKIWDCSECTYPHERKNAIKLLENLFK